MAAIKNNKQLDTRAGHVRSLLRDLRPATGPTITIGISHPVDEMADDDGDIDPETGKPRIKKKKRPEDGDGAGDGESDELLFPVPEATTSTRGMKK